MDDTQETENQGPEQEQEQKQEQDQNQEQEQPLTPINTAKNEQLLGYTPSGADLEAKLLPPPASGPPNPNPIINNHLATGPQPTPQAAGEHIVVQTSSGPLLAPRAKAATEAPHWYQKFWHVLQGLPTDITSVLTIFDRMGPKFRATTLLILKDVMVVATDAAQDAAAVGSKNAEGVVQLSEATLAAIRQLIQDALAGEAEAVADFKQLGIHVVDGELVVDGAEAQTLTAAATAVALPAAEAAAVNA